MPDDVSFIFMTTKPRGYPTIWWILPGRGADSILSFHRHSTGKRFLYFYLAYALQDRQQICAHPPLDSRGLITYRLPKII